MVYIVKGLEYLCTSTITAEYLDGFRACKYTKSARRISQQTLILLNYSLALPTLLRSVRRNHIHQIRAQDIIALQALLLELGPHIAHLGRVKALLDDAAHKRRKLRLLPLVLLRPELCVNEIQTLEGVVDFDAAEHVHAAVLARVALDRRRRVHDLELLRVGRDPKLVAGYDADDGEERALRLPALGAAACLVLRCCEKPVRSSWSCNGRLMAGLGIEGTYRRG